MPIISTLRKLRQEDSELGHPGLHNEIPRYTVTGRKWRKKVERRKKKRRRKRRRNQ